MLELLLLLFLLPLIFYYEDFRIAFSTINRDFSGLIIFLRANLFCLYCKYSKQTAPSYFDSVVRKHPKKTCFFFEDEQWTYEKVQKETYRVANYFQSLGYKKGDSIAILMENRPEYVCIWLGLSRIGVVTSLLNYNIRLASLEHCVRVAKCQAIIFGTELTHAIQEVIDTTDGFSKLKLYSLDDRNPVDKKLTSDHVNLTQELKTVSVKLTVCKEDVESRDVLMNIYTSGTTGLPKAVVLTHSRVFALSSVSIGAGLKLDKDILITPVPLYHVNGGVCGVTAAIFHSIPQVILRKFSASRYWNDCIKYNATASQYLGEIIRYLYNQPEKPEDKLHKVHTFFGNGVNPAIWEKFVKRFNNVKIKELYGSTEGNCNTMNAEGHVGACGYFPLWFYKHFVPFFFAKVDDVTGEIIRDQKTGLALHVEIGEPGELLGKIGEINPFREFTGYTDKESTQKKIIGNVKTKGDKWFRTGDLLVMDKYGYWYFKDRSGDTFRWKGENVSTAECESVVTRASGMKGSVVYGVQVPGTEGRCGMAAISDPEGNLDLKNFTSGISKSLPHYARPLFLRVINKEMDMTGTFKLQKVDLQKEGFDIGKIKDSIYFFKEGNYVPLDKPLYEDVISGKMRL